LTRLGLYLLAVLVFAVDQATKHWAMLSHQNWPNGSQPVIPGFFSFTYVNNTGGAFGVFDSARFGTDALAVASAVAAAAILVASVRLRRLPALLGVALALTLGGAVGNLADRVRLHYVVDFLDFHVAGHYWPVFNVADSAICVGVVLLALYSARAPAKSPHTAAEDQITRQSSEP
jgi:signal peptidase II